MNNSSADMEMRARMATAAAPYVHPRKGEGAGKKEDKQDRAKQAGAGKFAPSKPPLALVK
jgi:phage terminase small subunit